MSRKSVFWVEVEDDVYEVSGESFQVEVADILEDMKVVEPFVFPIYWIYSSIFRFITTLVFSFNTMGI